ncbi:arylformamidase [Leucobacter insecticola]|uniref:Kynurenine formamidase n=1 Tax=Leucobacter insecticola TaxID=2714934 RepID=A0A6G8FGD7_9MICO|nr:cyclase family protein [Leucobacter insecticola]QIM15405.1 arylformamidase [Leucobacter insecticola]
MIIDISPAIDPATPVWPGDTPFGRTLRWDQTRGDSVTVSTITTTTHLGAHIDAPLHVREGTADTSKIDLNACVGSCVVIDISDLVGRDHRPHLAPQCAEIVARLQHTSPETTRFERVLLRHSTAAADGWDDNMPGIDPEFVTWFGAQGGKLLGIDLASFDPAEDAVLRAHNAAVDAGVIMLEGLELQHAPQGIAELIALPLPLLGADAAPVRAILRTTSTHPIDESTQP